ncbi:unnamed protein product [Adineta ricciae]|uniref:Ubiquitin-like protease family profile domain-containing protein n=1 Tax=Adineta ricciae TaxID=249248 RepID=A0A814JXC9_ADIRI|nr:unnamed protein product [Adineta ricciae]CAF1674434.1 unnamed protein product [Adineta ricciae]
MIKPTCYHRNIEYNAQTVMMVLEEDYIVYLRKNPNGYSSYNETTKQFELLKEVTAENTGLSCRWMVFVYETVDIVFPPFPMQKTTRHQTDLPPSLGPEDYIDEFVNDLLPIYEKGFLVGSIHIKLDDMTILLSPNGDINDLIIDAHLSITASSAASNNKVLAVPSYLIRQIILKKLRTIPISWLNFDILLCPINQNNHWYIIIIDRKKNLILELDSSVKHEMPRLTNMKRILHILHLQHFLKTHKGIDFENHWKLITFENEPTMQQTDSHSCGIHLLLQAEAYVKNFKFLQIQGDQLQQYRYRIAEALLRKGEPNKNSSSSGSLLEGIPDSNRSKNFRKSKQQEHF